MKTLTALAITSALLLSTVAANAASLTTGAVASDAAAYQAGLQKLSVLKAASSRELSREFGLFSPRVDKDTISLDAGAYITVQKKLSANGPVYVGVVNAEVSYEFDN